MFALLALALVAAPALAQQTTGNITGRIVDGQGAAVPGVTVTGKNSATGFTRTDVIGRARHLSTDGTAGRHLRPHRGAGGVQPGREQGHRGQRRADARRGHGPEVGDASRRRSPSPAESPLIETGVLLGRRRRRHRAHREHAAERPAVREPRGDDPRRRARVPLRPDQEHAGTRRRSAAATAAT